MTFFLNETPRWRFFKRPLTTTRVTLSDTLRLKLVAPGGGRPKSEIEFAKMVPEID